MHQFGRAFVFDWPSAPPPYRFPVMNGDGEDGQASVEYLLTVAGVFLGLLGAWLFFDSQGQGYLRALSSCLRFPF